MSTMLIGRDAEHEVIRKELSRWTPEQLQHEVQLRLQRLHRSVGQPDPVAAHDSTKNIGSHRPREELSIDRIHSTLQQSSSSGVVTAAAVSHDGPQGFHRDVLRLKAFDERMREREHRVASSSSFLATLHSVGAPTSSSPYSATTKKNNAPTDVLSDTNILEDLSIIEADPPPQQQQQQQHEVERFRFAVPVSENKCVLPSSAPPLVVSSVSAMSKSAAVVDSHASSTSSPSSAQPLLCRVAYLSHLSRQSCALQDRRPSSNGNPQQQQQQPSLVIGKSFSSSASPTAIANANAVSGIGSGSINGSRRRSSIRACHCCGVALMGKPIYACQVNATGTAVSAVDISSAKASCDDSFLSHHKRREEEAKEEGEPQQVENEDFRKDDSDPASGLVVGNDFALWRSKMVHVFCSDCHHAMGSVCGLCGRTVPSTRQLHLELMLQPVVDEL